MNRDQQKLLSNICLLAGTSYSIPFGDLLLSSIKRGSFLGLFEHFMPTLALFITATLFWAAFRILDEKFNNEIKLKGDELVRSS